MRVVKGEILFSAFFLLLALFFLLDALTFDPLAAHLPLIISVPAVLLASAQTVRMWRVNKGEVTVRFRLPGLKSISRLSQSTGLGLFMVMGAGVLIGVLGVIPGIVLFNLVTLKWVGQRKWLFSLVLSAGLFAFIYLVFVRMLHIDFYYGVFDALR